MAGTVPTVLALDFDGVICDGMKEYFQTAWHAYCALWQEANTTPTVGLAERFYRTRPVVETGWEMPVLVRALLSGVSEADILANWGTIVQQFIQKEHLQPETLMASVDGFRDRWIASDLNSWLAEQTFYPGVINQLQQWVSSDALHVTIISTKEGRFIQALLRQQGVDLQNLQIFGKEVHRSKAQTLRELIAKHGQTATVWFVEDRLKTLQAIEQQPDLASVSLFLADWGYNTASDRQMAAQSASIHLISLQQFCQPFPVWLGR